MAAIKDRSSYLRVSEVETMTYLRFISKNNAKKVNQSGFLHNPGKIFQKKSIKVSKEFVFK